MREGFCHPLCRVTSLADRLNIDFALIHMDKSRRGQVSRPEDIYNRLEEDDDDDDSSMVDAETGHEIHRAETADETSMMTLVGDVQDKVCFIVVSAWQEKGILCRNPGREYSMLRGTIITFFITSMLVGRYDRWLSLILGGSR